MPFDLYNAPTTWQCFVERVLGYEFENFVFVYLDDIIIRTPTVSQNLEVLKNILGCISAAGLTLDKFKCNLCKPELKYLAYILKSSGLLIDLEKVEAIAKIPVPRSVTEVRWLIGISSWYRSFIPNFSSITAPLTVLLHKNQRFVWNEQCQSPMETIKRHLFRLPFFPAPTLLSIAFFSLD